MFVVGNKGYELVLENRGGWNFEMFRDRYSDVLGRYDYIAGDWGFNQLRLRGFFRADHPQATKETSIVYFEDYIHEYCNFGCAYFLVQKVVGSVSPDAEEEQLTDEG
jgi:uncharacterized protein YutD